MRSGIRAVTAVICATAGWPAGAPAQTVEEFYRGKSITMLVGSGAGGGYDTYARIFARHMARYIPGNPTIIAKNMMRCCWDADCQRGDAGGRSGVLSVIR